MVSRSMLTNLLGLESIFLSLLQSIAISDEVGCDRFLLIVFN